MRTREVVRPRGGSSAREDCFVVCARVVGGVSTGEANAIVEILNGAATSGWWFLNSQAIVAIFPTRRAGAGRAAACGEALEQLTAAHRSPRRIDVGIAEGSVTGPFTDEGIMESMPVGAVVAEAMRRARRAGR